jgi:hypothetical protein
LVGSEAVLIDTDAAVARQVARVVDASVAAGVSGVRFVTSDMRLAPVMRTLWGEAVLVQTLPV